jgi:hypothetical protein
MYVSVGRGPHLFIPVLVAVGGQVAWMEATGTLWAVSDTRLAEEALTVSAKYTTFHSTFWQDGHIFGFSLYYKIVF